MNALHPDILALISSFLEIYDIRVIKNTLTASNWEYEYFAMSGHLNILIRQWDDRSSWNGNICAHAAKNGHIDIIEWIIKKQYWYSSAEICAIASRNGYLNILQLMDRKYVIDYSCLLSAIQNDHLHILQWFRANNYPWNMPACLNWAIENRHQNVINWILAN